MAFASPSYGPNSRLRQVWAVVAEADDPPFRRGQVIGRIDHHGHPSVDGYAYNLNAALEKALEVRDRLVLTGELDAENLRYEGYVVRPEAMKQIHSLALKAQLEAFEGAADAHLVAADMAEEAGLATTAQLHRNRARRAGIYRWLREDQHLTRALLKDIVPWRPPPNAFSRAATTAELGRDIVTWHAPPFATFPIRIDRRGRVTWMHDRPRRRR